MAKNDEAADKNVQYATLIPEYRHEIENKRTAPSGIILLSAVVLGGAGLLRWKGLI